MFEYNILNKINAKKLRKEMTPWERKLWFGFLRNLEFKCYRQRMIGDFILDFYMPSFKLAIELDGSQHYEENQKNYDISRTKFLTQNNIKVLRFNNNDIDKNFEGVCDTILRNIEQI